MSQLSRPRFTARIIQPHELPLVDELRVSEYIKVGDFALDDPSVLHTAADLESSVVLGLWAGGELVGTIRLDFARTESEAQDALGMRYPIHSSWLPCAALSRVAVRESHQRNGFTPYLITLALQEGRKQGARSGIGALSRGAPHQRAALAVGWTAHQVPTYQTAGFASLTPSDFMLLEDAAYDRAVHLGLEAAQKRLV